MAYQLSISIFGPGTPERSHWGFVIHPVGQKFGNLLQVRLVNPPTNWFEFENRETHGIESQNAWGLYKLGTLNYAQRTQVISILEQETPPRGGTKRCQDWTVDALVSLEVEELVVDGTAQAWTSRIGKSTDAIKAQAGGNWQPLNNR